MWQKKLSSLQVAQFPWDPQPTPAPAASTPTVPSNGYGAKGQQQQPQPQQSSSSPPTTSGTASNNGKNVDGVRIKAEPGSEAMSSMADVPSAVPTKAATAATSTMNTPPAAIQRAATLMQQKFGSQANSSIGAMQSGTLQPGSKASVPATGQIQPQEKSAANPTQTDGAPDDPAAEWRSVTAGGDEASRRHADGVIRRRVEEMGLQMEGGGLMLPLRPRRKLLVRGKPSSRPTVLAADSVVRATDGSSSSASALSSGSVVHPAGYDGTDDTTGSVKDEDFDEDAINSDLDDPDDNLGDDADDDDSNSQVMLCMYDKVQRTKNKWKCVLKDGVLTVGGRE